VKSLVFRRKKFWGPTGSNHRFSFMHLQGIIFLPVNLSSLKNVEKLAVLKNDTLHEMAVYCASGDCCD